MTEKRINGHRVMAEKYKENRAYPENVAPLVAVTQIDDCVKHIFSGTQSGGRRLANLGAEGQRKITVERGNNTLTWVDKRAQSTRRRNNCGTENLCMVLPPMFTDRAKTLQAMWQS